MQAWTLTWLIRTCIQAMEGSSYSVLPLSSCTRLGSCLGTALGVGHTVLTMVGASSPDSASFSVTQMSSCIGVIRHASALLFSSPVQIGPLHMVTEKEATQGLDWEIDTSAWHG